MTKREAVDLAYLALSIKELNGFLIPGIEADGLLRQLFSVSPKISQEMERMRLEMKR